MNSVDAGRPDPADAIMTALEGDLEFDAFDAKHPHVALTQLAGLPVKELELTTFDGERNAAVIG
jgi:hypothetical protein